MKASEDALKDKKVLIVDDEPDILDTLEEMLSMCQLVRAVSFQEAKRCLEKQRLDIAVLDIMGVNGYELLGIAVQKKIPAVMLTAHALTAEDTIKSHRSGAAFFVPKDKISDIPAVLAGVLEAKAKGKSSWIPFMNWADAYYTAKFGPKWESCDEEFWKRLSK